MFYKGVATFQTLLMQVLGQFKRENATTVLSWDDLHWGGCTITSFSTNNLKSYSDMYQLGKFCWGSTSYSLCFL